MGNWDDSDSETAPAAAPAAPAPKVGSKWADEDAEPEVPESWSASESDSDSEEKSKQVAKKGPIRNKGVTKQKIAEREAEEEARRLEEEAKRAEDEDPAARKRREKEKTLQADMENAKALFGEATTSKPVQDPLNMDPRTKEDFAELSNALSNLVLQKYSSKPLYPSSFLEQFFKSLAQPLNDVQVRKLASALTILANEKQKAAKGGGKKAPGKAKPKLGGVGGSASVASKGGKGVDLQVYDDVVDGDYDFM